MPVPRKGCLPFSQLSVKMRALRIPQGKAGWWLLAAAGPNRGRHRPVARPRRQLRVERPAPPLAVWSLETPFLLLLVLTWINLPRSCGRWPSAAAIWRSGCGGGAGAFALTMWVAPRTTGFITTNRSIKASARTSPISGWRRCVMTARSIRRSAMLEGRPQELRHPHLLAGVAYGWSGCTRRRVRGQCDHGGVLWAVFLATTVLSGSVRAGGIAAFVAA
jgi:hypothetical protein